MFGLIGRRNEPANCGEESRYYRFYAAADSAGSACLERADFFRGAFGANSKPTLPFSNFRCAENARPFLEINFGSKSVLPVAISFCTCSFGISRCKIILLIRNVQVLGFATAFSHAYARSKS